MCKKGCIFLVSILFVAQLFAAQDPNLLAWYRFNETSGTTATDYSGNGNNGTVGSSSGWDTTGFNGKGCLDFNGTFNVDVPSAVYSNIDETVTVSVWVKSDDPGTYSNALFWGVDSGNNRKLGVELPGGYNSHLWFHAGYGSGSWDTYIYYNISNVVTFRGQWNNFTFTKDAAAGQMKIYINGVLIGTETGMTKTMENIVDFKIGTSWDGSWAFQGKMADFRLYNRVLGATEIADLADANLIGWWTFNEGSGSTAYDSTINRNDGALGNADSWITDGIDFAGSGNSGISFASDGLDIVSGLTDKVTISYVATWDSYAAHANYTYDGRDSSDNRLLSAECPTGNHILIRNGGDIMWWWEAFNEEDARFIFGKVEKTWGDDIRITSTADFNTGEFKLYINEHLYTSETGKTGSFADLVEFTIGQTTSGTSQMEGSMKDFRIYDKVLSESEIEILNTPRIAFDPIPADGKIGAATENGDITLRWRSGINTNASNGHKVYFGTSYNSVANATPVSGEYKGTQTANSYDLSSLSENTTYYWRIDEVAGSEVYKGEVYSFTISDAWLFTFHNDLRDLDADERICIYAIQGFVNKTKARLFLNTKGGNAVNITVDDYWLDYLQTEKGYKFVVINSLRELIELAKSFGFVDGLVLYDPDNLANAGELMPALNIASTQNRLPVTNAMLNYTSKELLNYGYVDCFEDMNTLDIRGDWATHLAAQTDYVNNHLAGTSTTGVCKVHQNFATFNDIHNFNEGLDYGISNGYFIMDMNPGITAEKTLFDTVMDHLTAPAMVFGGWHDEGIDLAVASEKGHYSVLGTVNLSFWAHVPADANNLWLRKSTTGKTLDPNKYYVMIQSSDGDAMPHETGLKPSLWEGGSYWLDDVRGTTPMTWTCQPLSATRWPAITEYYVLTSTANDTFCTGPSGAGYCIPGMMSTADQAAFAAFEEPYLQLTGLQWVEQWGPMGESMWNTIKANAPSIKCFGHQGTAGGRNHWLDDGTPIAIADHSLWYPFLYPTNPADPYDIDDPNNIVNKITAFVAGTTPDSTGPKKTPYFITVYDAPVWALTYSKQCQLGLPANYEMVTVEDFIDLMDQAVHPKAWGTLLTYDDFETSFGNWTDGGAYCDRSTQSGDTYSRLGTKSIHIYYKGTPSASFYHTTGINVNTPGYTRIKVTFWYVGNGMEAGDSFVLEYYNGTTWNTIKTYVSGTDFENGITNFRYNVVYIDEGTTAPAQVFPSNMKLRFRCTSNSTGDHIYIDCVRVEAQ